MVIFGLDEQAIGLHEKERLGKEGPQTLKTHVAALEKYRLVNLVASEIP